MRFTKGRSTSKASTFLVIQDYGNWLQVAVPVRPNGTVGWVLAADVQRLNLKYRVVVDLSANTMIVEHAGQEIYRESVASGTGNTPTPTGLFYVRDLIEEAEDGPYGPYVLALSGYSDVLFSFKGGAGGIGIHGTDSPQSIGSNASFGCVRITNDSIRRLVHVLPLGTPVEIVRSLADQPSIRRVRAAPDPAPPVDEGYQDGEIEDQELAEADTGVDIRDAPTYNAEAIDFIEVTTTAAS